MKVKYIREITEPWYLVGKVDEVRELKQHDAERLITEGYVVATTSREKANVKQGSDPQDG